MRRYQTSDEEPKIVVLHSLWHPYVTLKGIGSGENHKAQTHPFYILQVAINWCICKGTIPIPGVKTVKQAEENLGALGWRLSSSEAFELESAAAESPGRMVQNIFQTR